MILILGCLCQFLDVIPWIFDLLLNSMLKLSKGLMNGDGGGGVGWQLVVIGDGDELMIHRWWWMAVGG